MKSAHGPTPPQALPPVDARWQALVVICRQCGKRGSGPRDFKSKQLARTLRDAIPKGARFRFVLSSCLGLCPKRGIAVVCAGGAAGTAMWGVGSLDEGRQLAGEWLAPKETAASRRPDDGKPAA